jgi:predicted Co/Zn/Cd cation transporter (cation efflux family)
MKPFTTLAVIIFTLVALAHLYRLVRGLDIVVQGHAVPQWASIAGLVAAAVLAIMVWRESRQR